MSNEDARLLVTTTQLKDLIVVRVIGNESLLKLVSDYLRMVAEGQRAETTIDWGGRLIGTSQPMKIIFSLLPMLQPKSSDTQPPPTPEGGLN
jgi:hypothetical protein